MKCIRKVLTWELFRGIKEGKITSLIFDEDEFQDIEEGELITFVSFDEKIKMYYISSKIVPFKNITDEDAIACGFKNRDLLAHYLINKYNFSSFFLGNYPNEFDKKLFCLVKIKEDFSKGKSINNDTVTFSYYQIDDIPKKFSGMQFYNPEYDDVPWRDLL